MFNRLGTLISERYAIVIALWVMLAAGLHLIAPRWNDITNDGDLAYLPDAMPSVVGQRLLSEAFPDERAKSEVAVIVERPGGPLTPADLLWSDALAEAFRQRADSLAVTDVWNRNTDVVGDKLVSRVSKNGQGAVTILKVRHEFAATANMALLDEVRHIVDEARVKAPPGLAAGISGSAAIGGDMLQSAAESIRNTELTTIALVIIILLVVYRAPLLVLVPLVTIGVALFVSIDLLSLLTQLNRVDGFEWWNFKVFTTTRIFIVVILFGCGTDFCLFLIARYREELEHGLAPIAAVSEAVGRVSEALVASAMTTVCGLGMMYFADFGKFRNSGPAISLCLVVTLIACLTLAPALLRATGRAVFWPFIGSLRSGTSRAGDTSKTDVPSGGRFWTWAANAILARPGTILVASVALLAPFAYFGLTVERTYDLLNELEPKRTSVVGAEMARRHFAAGEMGPITVLAMLDQGHFNRREGERQIGRLTKSLYDMQGIESVRSISEPTGDPPGYFQPFRASGLAKIAARRHKITKARFLTQVPKLVGDVARFDLVFKAEPFSPEAIDILDRVETYLHGLQVDPNSAWHGAQFAFCGTTVGVRDLAQITASDQGLIEKLVLLAVFGVLLVLLRRPLVCFYLIVSVVFSYLVTIGVTQLYFGWLYGDTYYGLDWKVPIFLFVILIAVGEDYNIYLVTRVVEEQRRHGPLEGLRRAVARTGGIITSCGVIMAGTFISMTSGTLRGMHELGFALSLGILLDTCIVRPVLVPAFLALVERWTGSQASGPDGNDRATSVSDHPAGVTSHP